MRAAVDQRRDEGGADAGVAAGDQRRTPVRSTPARTSPTVELRAEAHARFTSLVTCFPLVDRGQQRGVLLAHRLEHVVAEQQPQRRLVEPDHHAARRRRPCAGRRAGGRAKALISSLRSPTCGVVVDRRRRLVHRPLGPVGAEGAGLDRGHLDAERRDLLGQRLGQRLERELRRGVVGVGRVGDEPGHRGDVDDVPAALRAHPGQHRLERVDDAEVVGVEERAHLGVVALLDRRQVAVAGVVDQHVDAAERGRAAAATAASICASVGDVERRRRCAARRRSSTKSSTSRRPCARSRRPGARPRARRGRSRDRCRWSTR